MAQSLITTYWLFSNQMALSSGRRWFMVVSSFPKALPLGQNNLPLGRPSLAYTFPFYSAARSQLPFTLLLPSSFQLRASGFYTVHPSLFTVHCSLFTFFFFLPASSFELPAFTPFTLHCLLFTVHILLLPSSFQLRASSFFYRLKTMISLDQGRFPAIARRLENKPVKKASRKRMIRAVGAIFGRLTLFCFSLILLYSLSMET